LSNKKIVLRNIFSIGIIQIANYIFPLITVPIVSRIIGPEKFGVINFSFSFVSYFTLFIAFGFDLSATRRVSVDPLNKKNRNLIFNEVFSTQCLLFAASLVLFIVLLFYIPQLSSERDIAIYSFITCIATVLTQNWLFQAMQDLHKIAVLSLFGKMIFTSIVLLTVRNKSDYYWQPLALSISNIIVGFFSFLWALKRYKLKLRFVKVRRCLEILWEEKAVFFTLCFISLYTTTNTFILGLLINSEAVGFYSAGQKLISTIQMILSVPFSQALFPYIGKSFGESQKKGITVVQKILPFVFVTTFICGLITFLIAPLFVELFFGIEYKQSILVCRILAFVPMFISLSIVLGIHVMVNLRMDKEFLRITLLGAVIGLILNYILVSFFSFVGASVALLLVEGMIFFMLLFSLSKKKVYVFNIEYFKPKNINRIFLLNILNLNQSLKKRFGW
jgi:PST family polysaccharide transporter